MSMAIPASQIVAVTPSVLAAGGEALDMVGLIYTDSTTVPIGSVLSFATAAAVGDYFGPVSDEAAYAGVYFAGYEGSTVTPGALLFAQYPTAAVKAYLRGGSLADMTLAELNALSAGTIIVTVNGAVKTSSSIDLSGAASFSAAAALIEAGLASFDATCTGAIAATTLTVSALATGAIMPGQDVQGSGVTAGTKIVAQLSGTTGGVGTYSVDISQSASSTALSLGETLVTYDSQLAAFTLTGGTPGVTGTITAATGTLAAGVKLTTATGAVTSQGAAISTPADAHAATLAVTQNFASFTTIFEPDTDGKVAWAAANQSTPNRFIYAMWDTSSGPTQANDTTSAYYEITQAAYSGVVPLYEPSEQYLAPFLMGYVASLDFSRENGRTTAAFRHLAGLTPGVTDGTIATNLIANGYNFYGDYATAADDFNILYPGTVSGDFLYVDSYANQIWLNNELQLALMILLTQSPSIPYNAAGYGLIEAACTDPVLAGLNFGAIRTGVPLSSAQRAAVNAANGGRDVASTLTQRGWYLRVQAASAEVRAARGSPPTTLWYVDGQSVQSINLASIQVQ